MVQEDILEVLQREIILDKIEKNQERSTIAILRGQSAKSAKALLGQELIIRYFPFHIGRVTNDMITLRKEPDLTIKDHSPYHLSRLHMILERREGKIFLVDPMSRLGSLVNGELLGEKIGGMSELPLRPGKNEIRMGGDNSPYIFTINVVIDDGSYKVRDEVRFGDHTIPVAFLYNRLCQQTSLIFSQFIDKNKNRSLRLAYNMVESILANPEVIDPLYYFSAVPETFKDMIVTHSLNVAIYALKFARAIPILGEDLRRFVLAALFHDIGMYDIPLEIINKRDLITDDEYEVIKGHSLDGKRRLSEIEDADAMLLTVALEHHERIDGRGYPKGRKDIAEYVELIAMVDFFEALTHYRPQRGPVTPHEGMRLLIHLRQAIFSPSMVKLFIKGFSLFPVYSVVRLNTGEIGQVVATNPDWPLRPTVRIFFGRNGKALLDGREIDLKEDKYLYIVKDISDRVFVDNYFKL